MIMHGQRWVYFDVDQTLLMWGHETVDSIRVGAQVGIPHAHHIACLKRHHAIGDVVVVWSQGGQEWAREVVAALGLEAFVHHVLAKPDVVYDDLKIEEWLINNWYDREWVDP